MELTKERMRRAVSIAALLVALSALAGLACRRGVPVVDAGEKPPTMDGTISGLVTTTGGGARLVGRRVEVINVGNGDRRSVSTSSTGGFTVKVPPGKYRLQIELRPGEAIVKGPETIDINASDLDSSIVVEVAAAPPRARPTDSTRGAEGLGSPIA
ncbi:MAG TPA: carboxypeptidase-like regulatory domain-containing protein [Vicinamibacterales bacterium]|nr:carboxypeptidase-like regulatory domain-containing protein [Vicinamibacterales bacterium]